jgi:uncharacterized protein with von Willebrand factor type A (vWA) domain
MARSDRSIGLYLLLVFLSGIGVGAGGLQMYRGQAVSASGPVRKTPEEYRREYLGEMHSRLNLDEQQVAKLQIILEKTHQQYKQFREQTKPEMMRIQQEQVDAVNALLKDEQKLEYEKMRAEREARRKARGDRGDGF